MQETTMATLAFRNLASYSMPFVHNTESILHIYINMSVIILLQLISWLQHILDHQRWTFSCEILRACMHRMIM